MSILSIQNIQVEVFWVATLCTVVERNQLFREPCCLHLQADANGTGKRGTDRGMECKSG